MGTVGPHEAAHVAVADIVQREIAVPPAAADDLALPPAVVGQVLPAVAGAGTHVGIQLHQIAFQCVCVVAGDLSGSLVDAGAGSPQHHYVQRVHVAAGVGDSPHTFCC